VFGVACHKSIYAQYGSTYAYVKRFVPDALGLDGNELVRILVTCRTFRELEAIQREREKLARMTGSQPVTFGARTGNQDLTRPGDRWALSFDAIS
jgi:hypothetical protein